MTNSVSSTKTQRDSEVMRAMQGVPHALTSHPGPLSLSRTHTKSSHTTSPVQAPGEGLPTRSNAQQKLPSPSASFWAPPPSPATPPVRVDKGKRPAVPFDAAPPTTRDAATQTSAPTEASRPKLQAWLKQWSKKFAPKQGPSTPLPKPPLQHKRSQQ